MKAQIQPIPHQVHFKFSLLAALTFIALSSSASADNHSQRELPGDQSIQNLACSQLDLAERVRCPYPLAYNAEIITKMRAELSLLKTMQDLAGESTSSCGFVRAYGAMIEELEGSDGNSGLIMEARLGQTSVKSIEERFAALQEERRYLEESPAHFRCGDLNADGEYEEGQE